MIATRQSEVKAEGEESNKVIQDSTTLSFIVIGGMTVFSILLVVLILWLNESVVIRPLNKLRKGLENIAAGDFEQQLEIPNRDEIGKLAASFTTALGYLRQMVRGVRIGEQLQSVTGQLSSVSNQQRTGATEQVSALMQVLASTQELERTAAQIAESAAQVAELSNDTLEEIGRVEQVGQINQQRTQKMAVAVSSTLSGVEQVGQQVEEFSQLMGDLGKRTDKIEKVVELLGSIADEVHLLALNASIEAAGAGQYGDRFRVVAQQIKQLAKRANQATTEANVLIRDVQGSCRDATIKVDDGLVVVSKVVTSSGELGQALEELELGSQQVSLAFNEVRQISNKLNNEAEGIKQATAQQRVSSTQVIGAVNLVEGVAQQNVTAAQQVVSSTSGLENLTHKLNEVLRQVKLAA